MIPFNKPFIVGNETHYIRQAVNGGKLSGNGTFTQRCQAFFEQRYGFKKTLLTTSGTDALEMAAMLCHLQPGDEVIIPSFTFVSTALAFVREKATVVFADSSALHPNLDLNNVEKLITPRTKAIVVVHYAGVACDMDAVMKLAKRHGLLVIEDAAQAIDAHYKGRALGGIGHLGCFSFHETKNITAGGEGGMLVVNDERFVHRAEILWEKGTNRAEFFRGEVDKYGWKDIGSSFLPAEINAAFLYAQLENIDRIQARRKAIWQRYWQLLRPLADEGLITLPAIPAHCTNNAHMFYLICKSGEERTRLIAHLKAKGVMAVSHYLALHKSTYYATLCTHVPTLTNSERFTDTLLRLPLFYEMEDEYVEWVAQQLYQFFKEQPDARFNQGLAYLNNSETGTINIEKKAKTNDVFNRIAHI